MCRVRVVVPVQDCLLQVQEIVVLVIQIIMVQEIKVHHPVLFVQIVQHHLRYWQIARVQTITVPVITPITFKVEQTKIVRYAQRTRIGMVVRVWHVRPIVPVQ